uniref:Putative secreted protein n=1 Tax=Anopheles triannulatus TaxID=58253 RepID=A0A2M4B2C6_9DIPT
MLFASELLLTVRTLKGGLAGVQPVEGRRRGDEIEKNPTEFGDYISADDRIIPKQRTSRGKVLQINKKQTNRQNRGIHNSTTQRKGNGVVREGGPGESIGEFAEILKRHSKS